MRVRWEIYPPRDVLLQGTGHPLVRSSTVVLPREEGETGGVLNVRWFMLGRFVMFLEQCYISEVY